MLYNVKNAPLEIVQQADTVKPGRGNPGGNKRHYVNLICAFDIETSRYNDKRSFMYIWQFQIGKDVTVIGRSWKEFQRLIRNLKTVIDDRFLVVYVHNLSFEFQFLSGIYRFRPDEVFAVENRKVLRADMAGCIEFRCSYLHSNMRLETYLNKMGVAHEKVKGFDYDVVRYPWTPLSEEELRYCVNDVRGLVEALEIEMRADGDDLRTIPATSTGYVRRDVKRAMKMTSWPWLKSIMPPPEIYTLLREAFRGGNTHANRFFAGRVLDGVRSYDRSSSYPDVQINCRFPVGPFFFVEEPTLGKVHDLIKRRGKAVLMRIRLWEPELKDDLDGCPYIPVDKCRHLTNYAPDNGRVLNADYLEMTVTDVDFRIIEDHYSWSEIEITDCYFARYGQLPQPLRDCIISYYKMKTELKGVKGEEIYYGKAKNKLNSVYGMSAQNPVKRSTVYTAGEWSEDGKPWEELLSESNRKGFFPYQWGVWTTAWARMRLQEGIDLAGEGFVYCDTDSVKYIGAVDWSAYNEARKADSLKNGAWADDPKGRRHFMGVYEPDDGYPAQFATRGAKKYCVRHPDGKLEATIAGVGKREDDGHVSGGMELEKHGGFDAFLAEEFTFTEAGGNELAYYDGPPEVVRIEGKRLTLGKSVTITASTYTLSDTDIYRDLYISGDAIAAWLLHKYGE